MSHQILRTLVSFSLAALLLVCMGVGAFAQEQQVGAGVTWSHSPGTGHEDGYGVAGWVVKDLGSRIKLRGDVGRERAPKSYLGNGSATRWEGQVQAEVVRYRQLHTFSEIGYAGVNNRTTGPGGYSKTAHFPIAGIGIKLDNKFIFRFDHFFRESSTLNRVSSDRVRGEYYLPFEERGGKSSRWLFVFRGDYQRVRFYQPWGELVGWHGVNSFSVMVGVGRKY